MPKTSKTGSTPASTPYKYFHVHERVRFVPLYGSLDGIRIRSNIEVEGNNIVSSIRKLRFEIIAPEEYEDHRVLIDMIYDDDKEMRCVGINRPKITTTKGDPMLAGVTECTFARDGDECISRFKGLVIKESTHWHSKFLAFRVRIFDGTTRALLHSARSDYYLILMRSRAAYNKSMERKRGRETRRQERHVQTTGIAY